MAARREMLCDQLACFDGLEVVDWESRPLCELCYFDGKYSGIESL
jgi:hypothetical protein